MRQSSKQNVIYSDVDLSFIPNPHTGDLNRKTNLAAIQRSMRNALEFNPYDVPFNSTLKSSIENYLFEQNSPLTRAALETDIQWLLTKVEPRISLQKIEIDSLPNAKGFDIKITYKINSINVIDSFSVVFEKAR